MKKKVTRILAMIMMATLVITGALMSPIGKMKVEAAVGNVYATNLLKCFFTVPPASVKNLVIDQTKFWLPLLLKEIAAYPSAKIITLGEPVFQALVCSGFKKVNKYWAYCGNTTANGK